jgi:hypothetical protein
VRLRTCHIGVSFGSCCGHTGTDLMLTSGVGVVTMEGVIGGGNVSEWVLASMLYFLGLGALVLPHGEDRRVVDLVTQLYNDEKLLSDIGDTLDDLASNGTALFNEKRTVEDFTKFASRVHGPQGLDPNPPTSREIASFCAEDSYYELDRARENWTLGHCRRRMAKAIFDEAGSSQQQGELPPLIDEQLPSMFATLSASWASESDITQGPLEGASGV